MRYLVLVILLFFNAPSWGQDIGSLFKIKKVAVRDSVQIDTLSINSSYIKVKTFNQSLVDTSLYEVNYSKAYLYLNSSITADSLIVEYLRFPEVITKKYKKLSKSLILPNNGSMNRFFRLSESKKTPMDLPFNGLSTTGSISRGITIGNNQNSVLNSELDLKITGKLSDKVSLRASIQDANIPLQENGYSQNLDEFDQVFIELYSEDWSVRAGDIDLENPNSYFANFSKRVQGLSVQAKIDGQETKTAAFASAALVRGQFATSSFIAQEGNQGPYKIRGSNNELYVLLVSGSETVYVNGISLERGATEDYIIDYNSGELIFNPTFPITSEMRVVVDYQYSERNYSRFVGYTGARHQSNKLQFGFSMYNENDLKNQPLIQNINEDQIAVLANAGDDLNLMTASSAIEEEFSENRILYRKETINNTDIFVFSNNPDDQLYRVNFTLMGANQGNYVLVSSNAIENIYEYIPPVNGILQGSFEPLVQLVAPVQLQLATIDGVYTPSENTAIHFELAASKNDLNLFSDFDDTDNTGIAAKFNVNQQLKAKDTLWQLSAFVDSDYIEKNFRNMEGLYNPEFNRDWNLSLGPSVQLFSEFGDQLLLNSGLQFSHQNLGKINYSLDRLSFEKDYTGIRHAVRLDNNIGGYHFTTNTSILNTKSEAVESRFLRSESQIKYSYTKGWLGVKYAAEDNIQKNNNSSELLPDSQRFSAYEVFKAFGDSTNVYIEMGYMYRTNDSLHNNKLKRFNKSNTYYLDSRLINSNNTDLKLYINYRVFNAIMNGNSSQKSLNSRLIYGQKLWGPLLQANTVFETSSGSLPQQDFTYVEVETGQGNFRWIDYNQNGIQELEEFEVAPFQDQGNYIRVLLPNQQYIRTHQNRFSHQLRLDFSHLATSKHGFQKFLAHFHNQTMYIVDQKHKNDLNNINLNPFSSSNNDLLARQLNFRNILFFNRGKQRYTSSYTFSDLRNLNTLSFGAISNDSKRHQFDFTHKIQEQWLVLMKSVFSKTSMNSENFSSKNYIFREAVLNPKLSYLLDDNKRFDVYYRHKEMNNLIGELETLSQHKYGLSFTLNQNEKAAITGDINYYSNRFLGNINSPVAYQMLEGLQAGVNYTWSLFIQKKVTNFMDLNLSYSGRKSSNSRVIHTGNVQLRAFF